MNNLARFSGLAFVFLAAACGSSDADSGNKGGDGGGDSFGGGDAAAGSSAGGDSGGGGESGVGNASGVGAESGASDAGAAGASVGASGGQGGAGTAGTGGTAGTAGSAAGSSGAPMLTCSADVTADSSNVGVTHFEVNTAGGVLLPHGTALNGTDAQHTRVGMSALQSPGNMLQIALVGPTPASGAKYTTAADLGESINGVANYVGFSVSGATTSSWVADTGTVVTIAAVGPGPLANWKVMQFTFSGAHMTPSMRSNDKATGSFTLSGSCTAAVQYE